MAERSSVHVTFFNKAFPHKGKSAEAGRPIFVDKEMVEIRFPGDNKRVHVAPANEKAQMEPGTSRRVEYIERFPEHYARFKTGEAQGQIGTPLSEMPFLTEGRRKELKAVNIHTAETLAALPDREIQKLGIGIRALVEQARSFIELADSSAPTTKLAAENEELRERMARLEAMLAGKPAPVLKQSENFDRWQDPDIKAFLKDATGALPKGNPKHETLVRLAEEAVKAKATVTFGDAA